MILHRAQIKGWKCFASPLSIGPFSPGLNILFAENGTGKSSFFEALRRGLLDSHRVSGEDLQRLRPWGTELTPSIAIEFETRGSAYLLSKTFLDKPAAALFRKEGEQLTPIAEDDAVHKQMLKILRAIPSSRGLSKDAHWGLTQVLWAPQGNLALTSLPSEVVSTLRDALSYQFSGAEGEEITRELAKKYQEYFTPNGKFRTGKEAPAFVQLKEKLLGLERSREDFQLQLTKVEVAQQELTLVKEQRHSIQKTIEQQKQTQARRQEQVKLYEASKKRTEVLTAQIHAAEARFSELNSFLLQVHTQRQEKEKKSTQLLELQSQAPLIQKEIESLEKELSAKKIELEQQRKISAEQQKQTDEAHQAQKFLSTLARLKDNQKQSKELALLKQHIAQLQETLKKAPLLEKADLQVIRRLLKEKDELIVQLRNAQISLEISPLAELEIIHAKEKHLVQAGQTKEFRADEQLQIELPGIARIVATGSTQMTTASLKTNLAAVEEKLRQLTAAFDTQDSNSLESIYEQQLGIKEELERQRKALLSYRSSEDLEREHQALQTEQNLVLQRFPHWKEKNPENRELSPSSSSLLHSIQLLEKSWEETLQRHGAAYAKHQTMLTQIHQLNLEIQTLVTKEEELLRRQADAEKNRQQLQELAIERDTKKLVLEEENKKLAAYVTNPQQELEQTLLHLDSLVNEERELMSRESMLQATIESLSNQGLYSQLSQIEEEMQALQLKITQEEKRALALKLLYETLLSCKTQALQAVAKPVEQQVTQALAALGMKNIRQVNLDESLLPESGIPSTLEAGVLLKEFSGGEQEQIHFVVRLALAEALARDERQFVVFDDVLTATDSKRAAKLLELFRQAANRLQIFILTCQPEKFAPLNEATWIDLAQQIEDSKKISSAFVSVSEPA